MHGTDHDVIEIEFYTILSSYVTTFDGDPHHMQMHGEHIKNNTGLYTGKHHMLIYIFILQEYTHPFPLHCAVVELSNVQLVWRGS